MKIATLSVFALIAIASTARAQNKNCVVFVEHYSEPIPVEVQANSYNKQTIGKFEVTVGSGLAGDIGIAEIKDTASGYKARAASADGKNVYVQLQGDALDVVLRCDN